MQEPACHHIVKSIPAKILQKRRGMAKDREELILLLIDQNPANRLVHEICLEYSIPCCALCVNISFENHPY